MKIEIVILVTLYLVIIIAAFGFAYWWIFHGVKTEHPLSGKKLCKRCEKKRKR